MCKRSLYFVFLFLFIFGRVSATTLNISAFVFTTPEKSVSPGVMSDEITVQTQNGGGTAEKVDETNDVIFSSSSATGEFLNSTGGAVSNTMSKNTSSRTFYYRDTSSGTFTLTVTIKGRDTGKTFMASQTITVGSSSSGGSGGNNTSNSGSNTSSSSSSSSSSSNTQTTITTSTSAHSSQNDLSDLPNAPDFKTDAGRGRVVSAHAPVSFDAKVEQIDSNNYSRPQYYWSFGDGTSTMGKNTTHSYAFPGSYNVVLNVSIGDSHSVTRTKIKVINPELEIVQVKKGKGGFVEIKNNSDYEINLENWKLASGRQNLYFPLDTIMDAHTSVQFPFEFVDTPDDTRLLFPNDSELTSFAVHTPVAPVTYLPQPEVGVQSNFKQAFVPPEVVQTVQLPEDISVTATSTDVASSALKVFEESKEEHNFIQNILHIPSIIFHKIMHLSQ